MRSTINGNVSNDVGGGFRSLGNVRITNSTLSGNTSTGWHGGAIFHTDGAMEIGTAEIPEMPAEEQDIGSALAASGHGVVEPGEVPHVGAEAGGRD